MKKYLLLLFAFIFIAFSYSDAGIVIMRTRGGAGAGDMCSACPDGAAGGDLVCETWETNPGTDCSSGWTDGGGTDEDNTPTGSWTCTNTNSENLEITFTDSNYTKYTTGHDASPNYYVFYFKVTAESLINNGDSVVAFGQDVSTIYIFMMYLAKDGSGNLYFFLHVRDDANNYNDKDVGSGPTLYTLGDEVRVRIAHDGTAGSGTSTYYVKVGSASEDTVSFNEDETDDNMHLSIIGLGWAAAESDYTAEYDFLRGDDDTMPAACSGDSY